MISHVEAIIPNRLSATTALRQAILKRAFEGKLVSQDPSDEPASALLERRRAERAAVSSGKGTREPKRQKRVIQAAAAGSKPATRRKTSSQRNSLADLSEDSDALERKRDA